MWITGTTTMYSNNMNSKEKKELKNIIKKIWNETVSETFNENYITVNNNSLYLGDSYDEVLLFLKEKLKQTRINKIKRLE
jgi:hypothetical protein